MDRLHATVEHSHRLPPEQARERIIEVMRGFQVKYPGYNLKHGWMDEAKTAVSFEFEKAGRGKGGGTATLEAGRVQIEVHAQYKLPFFVPVMAAEWRIREELSGALKQVFA
jgi:hypothetical protein